jgi:hypothetical protein
MNSKRSQAQRLEARLKSLTAENAEFTEKGMTGNYPNYQCCFSAFSANSAVKLLSLGFPVRFYANVSLR